MRLSAPLTTLLAALLPSVLADVSVTSPAAGATVPAGSFTVTFKDDGTSPTLDQLSAYTVNLFIGGNDATTQIGLGAIASGKQFSAGSSFTATVPTGVLASAGSTPNGFYLQFVNTATEGGNTIVYSPRFTVTGMTGTTPANVLTAISALGGSTAGPANQNNVANNAAAAPAGGAAAVGGAEFTVPYGLQTGLTKYAPMQPVPPTKITANQYTPLYPTSAFVIAKTWMPHPSIATTITASQTFSAQSMENTAAAASNPAGQNADMAKFLARWKD